MKKKLMSLLMAMVLILGVASPSFAAGMPGGEEGKTQCEVAELLSMSQVQVSRLEKKLLLQLRERVRM